MSMPRRCSLSEAWTEEMRAEARAKTQRQFAAWAAEHPDRAALVADLWARVECGDVIRPTCEADGRPMHPTYDWTAMAVVGWRCRRRHPVEVES
jgi:hypothetical protein